MLELLDAGAFFDMWAHALEVNLRADFTDEIGGTEQMEECNRHKRTTPGTFPVWSLVLRL